MIRVMLQELFGVTNSWRRLKIDINPELFVYSTVVYLGVDGVHVRSKVHLSLLTFTDMNGELQKDLKIEKFLLFPIFQDKL